MIDLSLLAIDAGKVFYFLSLAAIVGSILFILFGGRNDGNKS